MKLPDSLQDRIIELIPSKELQNAIKEKEYHLSEIALLATVYHCAPDFSSRIAHLRLLESAFTGQIKAYTARIIETQHQMLHAFLKNEPGAIYELHIKETPDSYDERYLCSSFDAAMKLIPMFYQEYNSKENPSSRYRIVKRRVFSAKVGETFSEDFLGDADLLPNGVIHSVNVDGFCPEDCDGLCLDCDRYCVRTQEIPYPCFTNHADAVKYRKYDGSSCFGIVLQWDDAPTNECYVIPLDSEQVRYRDYENAHCAHEHIPVYFVEKISPECLPDGMQQDYFAYAAYLNKIST